MTMMKVRNRLLSRLAALIVILTLAANFLGTVGAQDTTPTPTPTPTPQPGILAFEIYPKGQALGDFFAPTIDPGETTELVVVLANTGEIPFEGRTYTTNAHTAINGGFAIAEAGESAEGVTLWLAYPEEVYTIEPGTGIERTFEVTVPRDTAPGQYITSLVLENAEAVGIEGSSNFRQVVRFGVPVFITVPGPIEPGFEIEEITLTPRENTADISARIVNTGNVRVRPSGTITVKSSDGAEILSAPVGMASVYAHDSTSLIVGLPQNLPSGDYHIVIDLIDEETRTTARSEHVVTSTGPATPTVASPVQIAQASLTPRPDTDDVQFLDVAATILNSGEQLTNVQIVLQVTRDGQSVEDFPLASSLALGVGETPFQARYLPATGWESGTWQFTLSVEAVDPSTGVSQVLATTDLGTLEIS